MAGTSRLGPCVLLLVWSVLPFDEDNGPFRGDASVSALTNARLAEHYSETDFSREPGADGASPAVRASLVPWRTGGTYQASPLGRLRPTYPKRQAAKYPRE